MTDKLTPIQELTKREMEEGRKQTTPVPEIVQGDEGPVAVVPGVTGGGPAAVAVVVPVDGKAVSHKESFLAHLVEEITGEEEKPA